MAIRRASRATGRHARQLVGLLDNGHQMDTIRTMVAIQTGADPVAIQLDGARAGVFATRLAELMGIYERPAGSRIDRALVGAVIASAARAGLAEQVAARQDALEPGEDTIIALLHALRESPRPIGEITRLAAIFGYERLARLVSASEPSLRRYASEARVTPDPVAERIHYLAQLVAILRGSFNEFGIRRWFERPHPALQGSAPIVLLGGEYDPADPGPRAVLDVALGLLA
jgi:uncharacterized protein (DUF2384 family)